ncbi:MAG: DEAD/DEAH box helicase [Candidatus Hermodarchaeia archaeon]|jgi:SNF2 family DNA or RNA helicase
MEDFPHQIEVFNNAKDKDHYGIFLEQGLGKTRIAIKLLEYHFTNFEIDAVIIVTTKGLMGNWAYTEIPLHSDCHNSKYIWNTSSRLPPQHENIMCYFICNIDALIGERIREPLKKFFSQYKKVAFVLDESTVAKNIKAKRTKNVIALAQRCKYRYIMSGTPITNSPMDLFSQCQILKKGILGHNSLYSFKGVYADEVKMTLGNRSFNKIVGYRNLDDLTRRVQSFSSILKKDDCLDLPDKIYRTVPVDFTPEQSRLYKELSEQAITEIEGHEVSVVNMLSMITKLLQICAGQMKTEDGSYLMIKNNRMDVLQELVEECPGKTVVWTSFVGTAIEISKRFDEGAVWLMSGLSTDQRQAQIDKFREGEAKVLVANPQSAGHGITLVESSNVIYYSNSWNYEYRAQSEDRTHRIGQKNSVLYTDLITPNTVEQKVVQLLQNKKELANTVITPEQVKDLFNAG